MRWTTCLSLLICSVFLSRLYSQTPSYLFNRVGEEESWGNHYFNDIVQDRYGFIWFATYTGLYKYDGANTSQYGLTPFLPDRLKSSRVTSLFIDHHHHLWVGTSSSGVFRYNYQEDNFTEFPIKGNIRQFVEGLDGAIYLGTDRGVLRLNSADDTFRLINEGLTGSGKLSDVNVNSLVVDPEGGIWVGTECGLNKILWDQATHEPRIYPFYGSGTQDEGSQACFNFVKTIEISVNEKNALWVGTAKGLYKVRYQSDKPEHITYEVVEIKEAKLSKNSYINALFVEDTDRMWVGTNSGLKVIDPSTSKGRNFVSSTKEDYCISNNSIHSFCKDKFGNLWIGTGKGVNKLTLKGNPFSKVSIFNDFQSEYRLTGVIPSIDSNKVWVSSRGGGIYHYDFLTDSVEEVLLEDYGDKGLGKFITSLTHDSKQNIWLSTLGAGVIKVSGRNSQQSERKTLPTKVFSTPDGLAGSHIMSICATDDDNIWFGFWKKGLGRIHSHTHEYRQYEAAGAPEMDLREYHFTCFTEDEEGNLWAGTSEKGLFKFSYNPDEDSLYLLDYLQHHSEEANSLSSNYINCLLVANNGDLWIGTETGLDVIRNGEKRVTHVLPNADYKIIRVLSMAEEGRNIWFSSGDEIFKVFSLGDSLKIVQYRDEKMVRNPFQVHAAMKTSTGSLLFGATGGFTKVEPGLIYEDLSPPQVNLVSLKVNNIDVPIGKLNAKGRPMLTSHISQLPTLDLTHNENMLSIGFMGIHTAGKEKVSYAYKLEGFNKNWIYVDADDRIATYTNLPYKELTFIVKAKNASGIWSEPKSLSIQVQPPWWLSDGAYLCYALLAIGLLYTIWRIGRMRANFQHSLELEKVEGQKIKEVSRIKQEFYTHLSHELKTPLTLIITPLSNLLESSHGDTELAYQHKMMHRNASKLLKMINQLLDIQKKEVGISGLKVSPINLKKFIHEIFLSFIPLAETHSIEYRFEAPDGEGELWFDPEEVEKVVMNLLSNAFKFTPENGQIQVVVTKEREKDAWSFSVKDNGGGIEPKYLDQLFDRFFQVKGKSQRKLDKGSGIGLYLSKRIVEAHKGEIQVESLPGIGTTFCVSLPLGNAHFAPEELVDVELKEESILEEGRVGYLEALVKEERGSAGKDERLSEKPSILVVDDHDEIRSYLKIQLSESYQVEEARNGEEAWEMAKSIVPDLVLADISMPVMDGLQLCHNLKTDMVTSHIPVLLLTARSSFTYQFEGFQEGADAYVTKPFNFSLLELRIRNLILSRKKLREKYSQQISFQPEKMDITSLDEEFLKQVKEAINTHFQDTDFSVDLLASEVNMSRTQLYRKLKTLTGKSAKKLITDFRLEKAKDLLSANRYTVSEVSFLVGYNDIKSFRDQFKRAFNQNPRDFASVASQSSG